MGLAGTGLCIMCNVRLYDVQWATTQLFTPPTCLPNASQYAPTDGFCLRAWGLQAGPMQGHISPLHCARLHRVRGKD